MKKLLVALCFIPAIANAEFTSGNDLYRDLRSESTVDKVYALGYIAGVADAGQTGTHCVPGTVSLGQIRDMAINYLRNNPEIRNLSGDVLIGMMLMERWPCKDKPRGRGT